MTEERRIYLRRKATAAFQREMPDIAYYGVCDDRAIDDSRLAIRSSIYGDWYLYDDERDNKPIMKIELFEDLDMTLDDLLPREFRKARADLIDRQMDISGVTLDDFLFEIDREPSTIKRYIRGNTKIPDEILYEIAELLECSIEDLTPKDYIPHF